MRVTASYFLRLVDPAILLWVSTLLYPIVWVTSGADQLKELHEYLFWTWLFPTILGTWIISDALKKQHPVCYDLGAFLFFAWPLLAPLYLFKTRGWKALVTLSFVLGLFALCALEYFLLTKLIE